MTAGKVHLGEGALRPPSEHTYPRFSADYACRKCGGKYWGVHHEPEAELLEVSCNRCFFKEKVRPMDWPGPALEPFSIRPSPKNITILTHSLYPRRYKAFAEGHKDCWVVSPTPREALARLLAMVETQRSLNIQLRLEEGLFL